MDNISFAIVIATYKRKDGKTPFYLHRALESISKQSHQNYKVFLIGDNYETPSEVESILELFSNKNIEFENLDYAKEREKYSGMNLWLCGGVNAINYAINKALSQGFEYICHLDHDDWWYYHHLENINKCVLETNSDWICTKSTYRHPNMVLPNIELNDEYIQFYPKLATLIHSSVCMNFKKIPLLYRNVFEETGINGMPSDGDLWERTRKYIIENNLKSTLINKVTCRHDEEGYEQIQ